MTRPQNLSPFAKSTPLLPNYLAENPEANPDSWYFAALPAAYLWGKAVVVMGDQEYGMPDLFRYENGIIVMTPTDDMKADFAAGKTPVLWLAPATFSLSSQEAQTISKISVGAVFAPVEGA